MNILKASTTDFLPNSLGYWQNYSLVSAENILCLTLSVFDEIWKVCKVKFGDKTNAIKTCKW